MKSKIALISMACAASGVFAQMAQLPSQGVEAQATPQVQAPPETVAQEQRVFPVGQTVWLMSDGFLPDDIKTAGLHIEFADSPKLTANIEATLQAAGFNMQPADTATYAYKIRGVLNMDGKVQATNVPVGQIMEMGLANSTNGAVDWGTVAADTGITAALANSALQSGLMNSIAASGNVVEALVNATGLGGKFNTLLTGDRRGICLWPCTYWNHSTQYLNLTMGRINIKPEERKPYQQIAVGIYDDKLWPAELTNVGLLQLYRMLGVPDIPRAMNPQGVTIEDRSDFMKAARRPLAKK